MKKIKYFEASGICVNCHRHISDHSPTFECPKVYSADTKIAILMAFFIIYAMIANTNTTIGHFLRSLIPY